METGSSGEQADIRSRATQQIAPPDASVQYGGGDPDDLVQCAGCDPSLNKPQQVSPIEAAILSWINFHLDSQHNQVKDLRMDLRNGTILVTLSKKLVNNDAKLPNLSNSFSFEQKIEHMKKILSIFERDGFQFHEEASKNLVMGNLKHTIEIFKAIIKQYHFTFGSSTSSFYQKRLFLWLESLIPDLNSNDQQNLLKSCRSSKSRVREVQDSLASLIRLNPSEENFILMIYLYFFAKSSLDELLQWVNSLPAFKDQSPARDFGDDWADGKRLYAVVRSLLPDSEAIIDFSDLNAVQITESALADAKGALSVSSLFPAVAFSCSDGDQFPLILFLCRLLEASKKNQHSAQHQISSKCKVKLLSSMKWSEHVSWVWSEQCNTKYGMIVCPVGKKIALQLSMDPHQGSEVLRASLTMPATSSFMHQTATPVKATTTSALSPLAIVEWASLPSSPTQLNTSIVSTSSSTAQQSTNTVSTPSTPAQQHTNAVSTPSTPAQQHTNAVSTPSTPAQQHTNTVSTQHTDTVSTPSGPAQQHTDTVSTPSGPAQQHTDTVSTPSGPAQQHTDSVSTPSAPAQQHTDTVSTPSAPAQKHTDTVSTPSGPAQQHTDTVSTPSRPAQTITTVSSISSLSPPTQQMPVVTVEESTPSLVIEKLGSQIQQVSFTPLVEGQHQLSIFIGNALIFPKPLSIDCVDIDPLLAEECFIINFDSTKIEATKARVNAPFQVSVDCSAGGKGTLSAYVRLTWLDGNVSLPCSIRPVSGIHAVEFTPRQAGKHHLYLHWNSQPIPGSPLAVPVGDIASSCCAVEGPGVAEHAVQGMHTDFDITVPHSTNSSGSHPKVKITYDNKKVLNNVKITLVEPKSKSTIATTYRCKYTAPTDTSQLEVSVTLNGQHIGESPFKVDVKPYYKQPAKSWKPEPAESVYVRLYPENCYTNEPITVIIDASCAGTDCKDCFQFDLKYGKKTSLPSDEVKLSETGSAGVYNATFTPKNEGIYFLHIMYNAKPIPESGIKFEVKKARVFVLKSPNGGEVDKPVTMILDTSNAQQHLVAPINKATSDLQQSLTVPTSGVTSDQPLTIPTSSVASDLQQPLTIPTSSVTSLTVPANSATSDLQQPLTVPTSSVASDLQHPLTVPTSSVASDLQQPLTVPTSRTTSDLQQPLVPTNRDTSDLQHPLIVPASSATSQNLTVHVCDEQYVPLTPVLQIPPDQSKRLQVTFTPRSTGKHRMEVCYNEDTIFLEFDIAPKHPDPKLFVDKLSSRNGQCLIRVKMIAEGTVLEDFKRKGQGEDLDRSASPFHVEAVSARTSDNVLYPAEFKQIQDGEYAMVFLTTIPDEYLLHIFRDGRLISCCPYPLNVTSRVIHYDPVVPFQVAPENTIRLSFDASEIDQVTSEEDFNIQVTPLNCYDAKSLSKKEIAPELFEVSFAPTNDATFEVHVSCLCLPITGSPIVIPFIERTTNPFVAVSFEPQMGPRVAISARCADKDLKHESSSQLEASTGKDSDIDLPEDVSDHGDSGSYSVPPKVKPQVFAQTDEDDTAKAIAPSNKRSFLATATPKLALQQFEPGHYQLWFKDGRRGHYQLSVYCFGRELKGSPFLVNTTPKTPPKPPRQRGKTQVVRLRNEKLGKGEIGILSAEVTDRSKGDTPVKITLSVTEEEDLAMIKFTDKHPHDIYDLKLFWNYKEFLGSPFELSEYYNSAQKKT